MSLLGSETTIELALERGEFLPGEEVAARVTVGGDPDERIQAGRVELVYENSYLYRSRDRMHDSHDVGGSRETVSTTKTVTVATQPLPRGSQTAVAPGIHAVSLTLPPNAPPTALESEGRVREPVRWEVRAILDRRMSVDPDSTAPIVVRSRPDQHAAWALQQPLSGPVCQMNLEQLSARDVRLGDTISGVLGIVPSSEFEGRGVRVQLTRKRIDTPDDMTTTYDEPRVQLAGETRFEPGRALRYPFQLTVPEDVPPSFVAMYNHHHLYLEGVIDLRMKGDYTVAAELNVYSGPPGAVAPPAPAGWYPDPWSQATQRYWDGAQWTGHTHA